MTAVTLASGYPRRAIVGDIKYLYLKTDANAATGYTYDTNLDGVGGDFAVEILGTSLQNQTGTTVASCTFSATTGIITLPSISTGIHLLTVWGI